MNIAALGTYLIAIAAVAAWMRSRDALRHDAIVLSAIAVYFGIGTIDVDFPLAETWSPRLAIPAEVWSVVFTGALGYFIGSLVGRVHARRRRSPTQDGNRLHATALHDGRVLSVIGAIGIVGLLVLYGSPVLSGGDREGTSGYLVTVAMLIVPGMLLAVAGKRHDVFSARKWLSVVAASLGLLLTGYRTYTLMLVLSVAILYFVQPTSRRQRVTLVALGLVAALVVGVGFGYWRFLSEGNESGRQLVVAVLGEAEPSVIRLAVAYTFVGFFREGPSILGFIVDRYPDLTPHTGGAALVGMVTSPLPGPQWDARAILSEAVLGTRGTSLVSSIFGPWFLDFGYMGVALGLAIMGYVLSRVEWRALWRRDAIGQAAYAYGLVLYTLSVHSGLSDFVFAVLIPASFVLVARRGAAHGDATTKSEAPRRELLQS